MDTRVSYSAAQLNRLGLLSCTGDEARAFLHAQLTSDVSGMAEDLTRYAGWCSPKGRLLATCLVVPHGQGFLLQLARDLAPAIARRLSMFILRAKVKLADVSVEWAQIGLWGAGASRRLAALGLPAPATDLATTRSGDAVVVRMTQERFVILAPVARRQRLLDETSDAGDEAWALEEIRSGRPLVVHATQDLFVPQMVNLERLGAVDFKKGCYPGQEIVARTQYRGVLKRRMVRARVTAPAAPGDDLYAADLPGQASGTVVNAAAAPEGGTELLAVVQISSLESDSAIGLGAAGGPQLELLPLPYAT